VKDEKSVEIVEKLLAKGADVNAKDPRQGRTPLHNTARRGNCKAAELLIAAGADVSAKDKDGHTPLWYAKDKYTIDEDDKRIVELLRRHGAIE
jgi:ankyrin repeat protein